MSNGFRTIGVAAMLAAFVSGAALAAPTTYIGFDAAPNPPNTVPERGKAQEFRGAFLSTLVSGSSITENMETAAWDTAKLTGELFAGVADLSMDDFAPAGRITSGASPGRFNTSPDPEAACVFPGCKWWEAYRDFTITLDAPTRAFGFYGTDFGDFRGTLTLLLTDTQGKTEQLVVPTSSTAGNGSLVFFGFTDANRYYRSIEFDIQQGDNTDVLGFDDFILGKLNAPEPPPVDLPEPATLALVGASLLGLAATRRRQRR